ncbi:MAG TPA: hypothetical protein VG097_17605 [Gemmata sp.]|nr:hypothetical protein [Gemmata sp.]
MDHEALEGGFDLSVASGDRGVGDVDVAVVIPAEQDRASAQWIPPTEVRARWVDVDQTARLTPALQYGFGLADLCFIGGRRRGLVHRSIGAEFPVPGYSDSDLSRFPWLY